MRGPKVLPPFETRPTADDGLQEKQQRDERPRPETFFITRQIRLCRCRNAGQQRHADACRGEGKTTSHFDYSGPLTEAVLLGTIAIRVPHETLQWDSAALKIPNSSTANALLTKSYRPGWEVKWG